MANNQSIAEVIKQLSNARSAPDAPALTPDQRRARLESIRDRSLYWWESLTVAGSSSGIGAASASYREACDALRRMDEVAAFTGRGAITIGWLEDAEAEADADTNDTN